MALVAASTAGRLVDVDAPWDLAVYFAVMAMVLLGGTLWLVPSGRNPHPRARVSRVKRVRRPAGTTDPGH